MAGLRRARTGLHTSPETAWLGAHSCAPRCGMSACVFPGTLTAARRHAETISYIFSLAM